MSRSLFLFFALAVAVPATELAAQQVVTFAGGGTSATRASTTVAVSPLDRPAGVTAKDVTLTDGLELLHDHSGVALAYSPDVVPSEHRVSCDCADITVGRALSIMLAGLQLTSTVLDGDLVLIAPRSHSVQKAPTLTSPLGLGPRIAEPVVQPLIAGQISGRVTDQASGQPVAGVQVIVVGTNLGAMSLDDGRYTIPNVPDGVHRVRTRRLGFTSGERTVTVAGADVTVDFAISAVSVALDEVVVT